VTARLKSAEVLVYSARPKSRATVRRHYFAWREANGIPPRCDAPACRFHSEPLAWNGKPLPLIVDHVSGNAADNSAGNLRLLCPNCEAQLETRGGRNVGRTVNRSELGYSTKYSDGSVGAKVFPRGVSLTASVGKVTARGGRKRPAG
jgi:hypothetical protein